MQVSVSGGHGADGLAHRDELLPYLSNLGDSAFSRYNGVTGNLYLDESRRVHRELNWARFRKGIPQQIKQKR